MYSKLLTELQIKIISFHVETIKLNIKKVPSNKEDTDIQNIVYNSFLNQEYTLYRMCILLNGRLKYYNIIMYSLNKWIIMLSHYKIYHWQSGSTEENNYSCDLPYSLFK